MSDSIWRRWPLVAGLAVGVILVPVAAAWTGGSAVPPGEDATVGDCFDKYGPLADVCQQMLLELAVPPDSPVRALEGSFTEQGLTRTRVYGRQELSPTGELWGSSSDVLLPDGHRGEGTTVPIMLWATPEPVAGEEPVAWFFQTVGGVPVGMTQAEALAEAEARGEPFPNTTTSLG